MSSQDRDMYASSLVRREVLGMNVYVPGETSHDSDAVVISANENNFGTSDAVRDELLRLIGSADFLNRYPDDGCTALRDALSKRWSLPPDHFIAGNGLDDVITMLAMTFIERGDEVVVPASTFGVYANTCGAIGSTAVRVPMRADLSVDADAMAAAINERTKIVWICTPNNPTGAITTDAELERVIAAADTMPRPPLVIVDHAYADYDFDGSDGVDALKYVRAHKNVMVMRTLSKISGMAALRIGYAIAAPELLGFIARVRPPYTANAIAQAAAAVEVSSPDAAAFRNRVRASVAASRRDLEALLARKGVPFVPSHANFVFAFMGTSDERLDEIARELSSRKIYVRVLKQKLAPSGLRFSIGRPEENARLLSSLDEII